MKKQIKIFTEYEILELEKQMNRFSINNAVESMNIIIDIDAGFEWKQNFFIWYVVYTIA